MKPNKKNDIPIDVMPCSTGKKRPSIPIITWTASIMFLLLVVALLFSALN